jgi:hypothetical protein
LDVTYATAYAGQAGLDVVERFVDLLGMPVPTFSGLRDQVRECVETPWPRTSLGTDGGVRLFGINGSAIDSQLAKRPEPLGVNPFGGNRVRQLVSAE